MIPFLTDFLGQKPLYHKKIKLDCTRVKHAYAKIRGLISHPPAIHIVGTNGKGSTGRMIAWLAMHAKIQSTGHKRKYRVAHYTSPHILRFNERIWIDGNEVDDNVLEEGHRRLYGMLGSRLSDELSYFEYTTLLALLLFEECDLIVMEAGLGGEYDATCVLENRVLTVVTPIGLDHQNFLGETVEEIAATKLRTVPPGGKVLLAPQPYEEVYAVAQKISEAKNAHIYISKDKKRILEDIDAAVAGKGWPEFLKSNAAVALQALEILKISTAVESLSSLELFGRYYPLAENIRIDTGHNPLAAQVVFKAMKTDTILIYNSLKDKDYQTVLSILKPKLKQVELIPIEHPRAVAPVRLHETLRTLGIPWAMFDGHLYENEHYLVFGSFYTVEAFLKFYKKRL